MHRVVAAVAATVMLAATAAGCAGRDEAGTGAPSTAAAPRQHPSELVGLWRVSGAQGEEPDTWLRLDARSLRVLRACGSLEGAWRGDGTAFVGSVFGWSSSCSLDSPSVPWLDRTATYRLVDDGAELRAADGSVVATLSIDGAPGGYDDIADELTTAPTPQPTELAALDRVTAPPRGVRLATAADLVGSWKPADLDVDTDPGLTFGADGTYSSSDGCNRVRGRWAVSAAGTFLATSGFSTLVGCEGAPVDSWVHDARWASIEHGRLVLIDAAGRALGRLDRA
ncbi:META domain-containing protein [Cellulomonas sp. HZM]|uniref:META domain-containing protein n=1 Tax=Cellulomonas sp. HZM TaxID=1454010 RepID=UPI000493913B|nr:META domain-containing protein [Cellulomonas sp. HZM]